MGAPAPVAPERLDLSLHREMRRGEMSGLLMRRLLPLFALPTLAQVNPA